jgi:hypothetical protein
MFADMRSLLVLHATMLMSAAHKMQVVLIADAAACKHADTAATADMRSLQLLHATMLICDAHRMQLLVFVCGHVVTCLRALGLNM